MGIHWRPHIKRSPCYIVRWDKFLSVSGIRVGLSSRMPCLCLLENWEKDLWDDTLWHSSSLRHLLRKPTIREPNNIFNKYSTDVGWRDYQFGWRWKFVYSDNSHLNLINTNGTHCLWCSLRKQHSREKRLADTELKWSLIIKFSRVGRDLLYIVRGLLLKLT